MAERGKKPARRIKKRLLIQLLVSAALLTFVLRRIDSAKLLAVLERVSFSSLALLVCFYLCGQLLSATKWRIFVRSAQIERSWTECARAYFLGMFVNSFGLGTVGGDVTRAVALRPEHGKRAAAFATVVADRLHGLCVLLTIGAVGIALVKPPVLGPYAGQLAWAAVIGLAVGWFIGPPLLIRIANAGGRFGEAAAAIARAFPKRPAPLIAATAISALFHTGQLLMHWFMAYALGLSVPLGYLFATIPIANAASTLPVSIQGLGVRESAYLFLLQPIGVDPEVCFAFGALWFLTAQFVSAIGALVIAPGLLLGREKMEDLVPEAEIPEDLSVANSV